MKIELTTDQIKQLIKDKYKKGEIMEFLIGTSCFIGGAFVGAVLMAMVAGSKRKDDCLEE